MPATGSVSGNVITIDVPISGGFGLGRPILSTTLYNVTALSAGRNNASADIYADLDATRAFDFQLGNVTPPPPNPCKVTGGGAIMASLTSEGRFGLTVNGTKGKVDYRDDSMFGANFRSTRILQTTCTSSSARIEGQGVNNGHAVDFLVNVVDNGEAGTTDTFSIAIADSPPYSASGTLVRGNIQVH